MTMTRLMADEEMKGWRTLITITGASGNIGQVIAELLLGMGAEAVPRTHRRTGSNHRSADILTRPAHSH